MACACSGAGPSQGTASTVTLKAGAGWTEAADASQFPPWAASMCLSCIWSSRKKSWPIRAAVFCTGSYCHIDFKDLNTNDLCFKPIKFHVLPISTQANVLKIPILAQWWCLGASWPSRRRSLTQTAPEILQPNKRVGDGSSHLCYMALYPGIWTWPKGITTAQLRPRFTL